MALGLAVGAALTSSLPPIARGEWHNFSTGDGLPYIVVRQILEDRDENLWFATERGGVALYDGVRWRTFGATPGGLPSNMITSLLQDRSGVMWFGTGDHGVARYDGSRWETLDAGSGLGTDYITSIMQDRAGNHWFATGDIGVCVLRTDGTWARFTPAGGMPSQFASCVFEDHAGRIWMGTSRGLVRWDGPGSPLARYLDGKEVRDIVEDRDRNLWFATLGGGVARLDTLDNWTTFTARDGLAGDNATSLLVDRSGALWLGTLHQGVSRFYERQWRTFHQFDGLWVHDIAQDRSGNLWFGNTGGATRYDGVNLHSFIEVPGLSSDLVYKSTEDRDGSLWFGTRSTGAWHYDGSTWRAYTMADGLASDTVLVVLRDRTGNLWFPCYGGGVTRRDTLGVWRTFTTADGLASSWVRFCYEDRDGRIWVTMRGGVSMLDNGAWTTFTTPGGPMGKDVGYVLQDRLGNMWFSTWDAGVFRLDTDQRWRNFTTADGLASNHVWGIFEDRDGSLWFGCRGLGASRLDAQGNWRTFTSGDGLANNYVITIGQDRAGNLWFAQDIGGGVTRYDGTHWRNLGDGNASSSFVMEDRTGNLWISNFRGVSLYEPDRVPPRTVITSPLPPVSPSRRLAATFSGLAETDRLEFSHRLDGGAWSSWSANPAWSSEDLLDGPHVLEVMARDYWINVDPTPAVARFEVDATPPIAVVASPAFGSPVRGTVEIRGTASDARFARYQVSLRRQGVTTWEPPAATSLASGTDPVIEGSLATWETSTWSDGAYEVRLAVTDTLGLTGAAQVTVVVDNVAPFFDHTSPVQVTAAVGGDVYTTGAELHLYVPPHGFAADAVVSIEVLSGADVPPTLPEAGAPLGSGYALDWGGQLLVKPAVLDVSLAALPAGAPAPALYRSSDGVTWSRLGGTVSDGRLSLGVTEPGRYALYGGGPPAASGTLSGLSFTPRVFSPRGTYGNREVGIGFVLGRAAAVTVKVYDPTGRLVREVSNGETLGPGANLVRWDGRDRDGDVASDGLYLVTVEALGETQKKALAVVR